MDATERDPIPWLLQGDPWVRLRTRLDLMRARPDSTEVQEDRRETRRDLRIIALVKEVSALPWPPLTSHKSASHPIHKLTFLADLGLNGSELELDLVASRLIGNASEEGPLQVPVLISKSYGGSGGLSSAWALCDAPTLSFALCSLGYSSPVLERANAHLMALARDNGWPCAVSASLKPFHGPGKKSDPCPYATLAMLKLALCSDSSRNSSEARTGAKAILDLWEQSRERHPYMFFMGTDFRKIKAPLIWYDILHVADVLSRFDFCRGDDRLREMIEIIGRKADQENRFTPESIWTAWKDWEFGQKKEPSRWLTFLAIRLQKRFDGQ